MYKLFHDKRKNGEENNGERRISTGMMDHLRRIECYKLVFQQTIQNRDDLSCVIMNTIHFHIHT